MTYKPRLTPQQRRVLETVDVLYAAGFCVTAKIIRENYGLKRTAVAREWLIALARLGYLVSQRKPGGIVFYSPVDAPKPAVNFSMVNGVRVQQCPRKYLEGYGFNEGSLF